MSKNLTKKLDQARQMLNQLTESRRQDRFVTLVESKIENYEMIIAAKSITDTLQQMAEKSAALEADDVMPLVDGLRSYFGSDVATRFNDTTVEAIRSVVSSIQSAKDTIGNEILRLEAIAGGNQFNDMFNDIGDETEEFQDMDVDIQSDGEVDVSVDTGIEVDDMSDDELEAQLDSVFDDSSTGRVRKESASAGRRKVLESSSKWEGLDAMTRGYIEAILQDNRKTDGFDHKTIADFTPAAIKRIKSDVSKFAKDAGSALEDVDGRTSETREKRAGRDFYYGRQGDDHSFHGSSWSKEAADKMQKASNRFGRIEPSVNDDGKIVLSGTVNEGKLVRESFTKAVNMGNKGIVAAKLVAERFNISVAEVGKLLKENADNLDAFTRGYIEALLWTDADGKTIDDLAPETLEKAIVDCRDFQSNAIWLKHQNELSDSQGGHDFWLTRNGHGAGFWDRDELSKEAQTELSDLSREFGEIDAYEGDDGLVYLG